MSNGQGGKTQQKKPKNVFKDLINIIDTIYGGLLGLSIFYTYEHITKNHGNANPGIIFWKSLFLIILSIMMLEDYVAVRMVNAVKKYQTTLIFTCDVLIAISYFLTVKLILDDKQIYPVFLFIISLLSSLWAGYLFYDKKIEKYYKNYFSLTWLHSSICVLLWAYWLARNIIDPKMNMIFKIKDLFLTCVASICILVLVKCVIFYKHKKDVNINPFIKHTGPFISKPATYLIMFVFDKILFSILICLHTLIFKIIIKKIIYEILILGSGNLLLKIIRKIFKKTSRRNR